MNKSYPNIPLSLLVLFFISFFGVESLAAKSARNKAYESYIDRYSNIAVEHMKKHKIPASITLAQGLLESGAGQSVLAVNANNHFGIKCHTEWKGATIRKDDDARNECFRKYKRVEDSYTDHSLFLTQRSRYSFLFVLHTTDYKGWAKGLQTAGYATDKAYANKLIKLIEDYELYQFDKLDKKDKKKDRKDTSVNTNIDGYQYQQGTNEAVRVYKHTPYITHGLVYVIAREGDSYESIADEFDFKEKDLYKYNEVPKGFPLAEGDLVYFQNKNKKANKPYYEHVVKVGESMHSVSQIYGVKVKNLYKMNKKDIDYVPVEGDVLKLR